MVNETSDKSNRCIWQDDAVFKPKKSVLFFRILYLLFVLKHVGKGIWCNRTMEEGAQTWPNTGNRPKPQGQHPL